MAKISSVVNHSQFDWGAIPGVGSVNCKMTPQARGRLQDEQQVMSTRPWKYTGHSELERHSTVQNL